ncbi:carbohydrate ABC transporter permease [Cohnella sp. WQ 127256]|uniref:carbohydrate ABC transporter permease n=1 Tax=Cohnella sp. WQ 127256 TaxID=2938790 RepID=UPI002117CD8B|nr:carbohydrate ABC transporter permease [Cohnella sp. WQ 127256]
MRKYGKLWIHIVVSFYILITIYPLFFAFINSFKTTIQVIDNPFSVPFDLNFANYINVWESSKISTYFFNSLYISTLCSVVSIVLAAMVAYVISRMRYRFANKVIYLFLGFNLLVPGGFLLIPLYFLLVGMQFDQSSHAFIAQLAIILPYITFGIPLTTFIIAAFMKSIPAEMEEAGVMDGLGAFGLFWRLVLPLTVPALVTVFILCYLGNWNEFIMANFFIAKDKFRTLPVGTAAFNDTLNKDYGGMFAATMFSIVPVALIYAFLQRRIIDGVTAGSIKG